MLLTLRETMFCMAINHHRVSGIVRHRAIATVADYFDVHRVGGLMNGPL